MANRTISRHFTISNRRPNDPILYEYELNSNEYTFVASAINIAIAMLEQEVSKQQLADIAYAFDNQALRSVRFGRDANLARQWTDYYLTQLRTSFPPVVIDDSLTDLDCLGYHPRMPWNGALADFKIRLQGIHLNGPRVRAMVTAGTSNSERGRQTFLNFQFLFATTLVHESAHLLLTFLGNGRPETPPRMSVHGYGTDDRGEAGRYFELNLFGGTTEFYRDNRQDNSQTGVPHQIDVNGRAWRIRPRFIAEVCRYEFRFPFPREGNPVDPRTMRSMGRNSNNNPPMGARDRTLMAHQANFSPQLRLLRGHRVRVLDLRRIPLDPTTRLVAVQ